MVYRSSFNKLIYFRLIFEDEGAIFLGRKRVHLSSGQVEFQFIGLLNTFGLAWLARIILFVWSVVKSGYVGTLW